MALEVGLVVLHRSRPLMAIPMLGEFALRLAAGLAGMLVLTSRREVAPAFFRTHCQIVLALLVLAALDLARASDDRAALGAAVGGVMLSYLASIAWGLGLPRLALPMTALVAAMTSAPLIWSPGGILASAGRLASAALLGSAFTAMLLGHHYLTAPAMSIDPLRRLVACLGGALALRAGLAAVGLGLWAGGMRPTVEADRLTLLFLAMRWGLGIVGPAIGCLLAWKTVRIHSTQSATGILYIVATLILFGELSDLTMARQGEY